MRQPCPPRAPGFPRRRAVLPPLALHLPKERTLELLTPTPFTAGLDERTLTAFAAHLDEAAALWREAGQ